MVADNVTTKVCPGFTGDMLETETDAPPVPIEADPLGGALTAVIVTPAGAVRINELIDELPDGVAFLNVAVNDAVAPAATDAGDMVSVKIFSGDPAEAGPASAATNITARKPSILNRRFMNFPLATVDEAGTSINSVELMQVFFARSRNELEHVSNLRAA